MAKNMDYENFINEVPEETKNIIIQAIKIYNGLKNENFVCNKYNNFNNNVEKAELNDNDIKCISFLLSFLTQDTYMKQIVENDFNLNDALSYLGKEEINISNLTDEKIKNSYNKDFKLFMTMIGNACDENEQYYPEIIFKNLCWNFVCGSEVLDHLYKFTGRGFGPDAVRSTSFTLSSVSLKQKLEKEKKPKNKDRSSRGAFPFLFGESEEKDILEQYGEVLNNRDYKINPAIGRQKELVSLEVSLLTTGKSVIITGEPGVGKTALVEGLAYLIKNDKVPGPLKNKKIVKINVSSLLSGTIYRGQFEQRVEDLVKTLIEKKDVILFIDEMHTAMGAGRASGQNLDLANFLKPYLDRGQIKIIGSTTDYEYEEYIKSDGAFRRRFEKVNVKEPSKELLYKILTGTIPSLESETKVTFVKNGHLKSQIINLLINITDDKHRVYNDKINNPDLALSILKKIFAFAILNGNEEVSLTDVSEAIKDCDRIYKEFREEQANNVLRLGVSKESYKDMDEEKIIKFPS